MMKSRNMCLAVLVSAALMLTMTPFMATYASAAKFTTAPMVAGGYAHSLALKDDGTVWGWGTNNVGQLGDGKSGPDAFGPAIVQVKGEGGKGNLTNVTAIAAGGFHSLAIKDDGTVFAWGGNSVGSLGDGTTTDRNTPVKVVGLTDVKAIAAGYSHSLAVKNDGSVWAWGYNNYCQLGNGATDNSPTPVKVKGEGGVGNLTDVKAIAAGTVYSLALKRDGTVWAWGNNDNGQLGDGTYTSRNTPVKVLGNLTGVAAIAAGGYHSLALKKEDGTVWAWGWNGNGQLGDGTNDNSPAPAQVKGEDGVGNLTDVKAIAAGGHHCFAVKNDGTVLAWGGNFFGQVGDGTDGSTASTKNVPVKVVDEDGVGNLTDVAALAGGFYHSLAVKNDGSVWAWGSGYAGELGNEAIIRVLPPSK
ncbi:MAG: hypothetical protein LBQ00_08895 [Syntrophobacterales bacterium]|nr:hypothetical protein [Syntrophobacterales bacterium]